MLTLGIETSGRTASVALIEDGIMLGQSSLLTRQDAFSGYIAYGKKAYF